MIQITNLTYTAGQQSIIQPTTFTIDTGSKLAILGDNGAGKSTFFDLLTDIIHPSTGAISYDNQPFKTIKAAVGYCRDHFDCFARLTVKELIRYMATLYGKTDYATEYEILNIRAIESKFMRQLSLGERKRVNILLSIMHQPRYLFLDEVTADIDSASKQDIWEKVLLKSDRTVLFATHQWEDAEQYAEKVVFLKKGQFLCKPMSKQELIEQCGIEQKVAVHQSIVISDITAFHYTKNEMTYYLLANNDKTSRQIIRQQTNNFTIMPVNLEDLYQLSSKVGFKKNAIAEKESITGVNNEH